MLHALSVDVCQLEWQRRACRKRPINHEEHAIVYICGELPNQQPFLQQQQSGEFRAVLEAFLQWHTCAAREIKLLSIFFREFIKAILETSHLP